MTDHSLIQEQAINEDSLKIPLKEMLDNFFYDIRDLLDAEVRAAIEADPVRKLAKTFIESYDKAGLAGPQNDPSVEACEKAADALRAALAEAEKGTK